MEFNGGKSWCQEMRSKCVIRDTIVYRFVRHIDLFIDHGNLDVSLSVLNCTSSLILMCYHLSVQACLLFRFQAAYFVKLAFDNIE